MHVCNCFPLIFPRDIITIVNCRAVKFGIISQTPSEILANLKSALPAIAKKIWGGWENIQSIHIKTNSSVSLPIWMCSLDDSGGGRWGGGLAASTTKPASAEENEGTSTSHQKLPMPFENEPQDTTITKGKKKRLLKDEEKAASKKSKTEHPKVNNPKSILVTPSRTKTVPNKSEGKFVKGVSFLESDKSPAKDTKSKYSGSLAKRKDKVVNRKEGKSAKSHLIGRKLK